VKPQNAIGKGSSPEIIYYSANDRVAKIVLAGLLQCDFRAIYANNPYLTIIKAMQFLPKMIIIDIDKANTKGFSIIAALEKSIRTRNITILLMLPKSPPDLLDQLKQTYWDSHIEKRVTEIPVIHYPFSFAEFINKIRLVLQPHK
jgi:hypothetical protein